ncbi:pyridoxamine 5'-phosphate oxidase family protein [Acidimicrobiaceae bacterium AH-315-P05]|nr:pyridoxamine 5'-phosphate oxidase family protein [Acidimicrobiaceae bacterium AH-315-P05]
MDIDVDHRVTTIEQLGELYRPPAERAAAKVFSVIDEVSSRFIEYVSFAVLSTSDGSLSSDASPRGGPPGFIQQLDDRHVAIPDLVGNNRLDSFRNILANPIAGLLLVVPGNEETLRINGPAALTVDPDILDRFTGQLRRPKLAIVIETAELYGHCAKAFRRGGVWSPDFWSTLSDAPDLAEIYSCQFADVDERSIRSTVQEIYRRDLRSDGAET